MITIFATVKVKEGKMDQAIEAIKEAAQKIRDSEPGTKAYIPHTVKGSKGKNMIIFYEKYENEEAFKLHSDNLLKSFAKVLPFLEPGLDTKKCEEII
jgi:quinol monooxygenase YgiN